jgi:hypothetical protein
MGGKTEAPSILLLVGLNSELFEIDVLSRVTIKYRRRMEVRAERAIPPVTIPRQIWTHPANISPG